jgi:hypothetical protein
MKKPIFLKGLTYGKIGITISSSKHINCWFEIDIFLWKKRIIFIF